MERTLVLIKPDGVARNLVGEVLSRFEKRGIKIVGMKMIVADKALVQEHYAEHKEKPFYGSLVSYLTGGPVAAFALEADNIISIVRLMTGATNPKDSLPGTIRGDYALTMDANVIHASANASDAERELGLWFKTEELL